MIPGAAALLLSILRMDGAVVFRDCNPEPTDMLIGYEEVIRCQIGLVGDTDQFRFAGTAGAWVRLQVSRSERGWPVFQVLTPAGTAVVAWRPAWYGGIEFQLPATGQYRVLVAEWYSDETAVYELFLQQTRPPVAATELEYDQSITGETTYPAEIRFFQFRPALGEQISIQLNTISGGQPCLQVFAATPPPTGTLLFDSNCQRQDASPKRADFIAKHAGTHIVRVADALSDQKVRFTLFLECRGTCSAPPGGFPTAEITLTGCASCAPTSIFAARVNAKNTLDEPAELKVCFLAPDGLCIPIGNTHRELPARLAFDGEVFRGPLPGGFPPGTWSICARLLKLDCGETIAATCSQITAVPLGGAAATAVAEEAVASGSIARAEDVP